MFTLAHELAYLWLDASALSNLGPVPEPVFRRKEEVWCNAVAAELLVPLTDLHGQLQEDEALPASLSRLACIFKVSKLVILRRLFDVGRIDRAWSAEVEHLQARAQQGGGGNFYNTTRSRVGRRFAHALISSTLEGQTLYRGAFRMLGVSKPEAFNALGREVGVVMG